MFRRAAAGNLKEAAFGHRGEGCHAALGNDQFAAILEFGIVRPSAVQDMHFLVFQIEAVACHAFFHIKFIRHGKFLSVRFRGRPRWGPARFLK